MPQHLTIRVPWHDSCWNGSVCKDPKGNISCLRLPGIFENKDEGLETNICGQCMADHEEILPCISEGSAFMSKTKLCKKQTHPYKIWKPDIYGHFLETDVVYPEYSFPARPYAWLLSKDIADRARNYGIEYNPDLEPISFNTSWVQHKNNHEAIFNFFYGDVEPNKSLCVAYAKQVPFCDTPGRVIIGIGYVEEIVPAVEHNHTNEGTMASLTWETHLKHSIRKDHKNGFLIPYEEMIEFAQDNPDFDFESIVVKAPDYAISEYSYATEHLSFDALIDTLRSCISAFRIINECLDEDYSDVIIWLNERLNEVWVQRGSFPGLGPMFCALGIEWGMRIASEFKKTIINEEDFWLEVDGMFASPEKYLSDKASKKIDKVVKKTWKNMSEERKTLFKLLSRYSLSICQACVFFEPDRRDKKGVKFSDTELIENPYILYERTRLKESNGPESLFVSIENVDKAIFPIEVLRKQNPLDVPSVMEANNDERRVRALAISVMEKAADNGHTIYPETMMIDAIKNLTPNPECIVSFDMLRSIQCYIEKELLVKIDGDNKQCYKLRRIQDFDDVIERSVKRRINSDKKLNIDENWEVVLEKEFGKSDDADELKARKEKSAVLKMLAESRLSVLIGGAGTGKTKTLSIFCKQKDVKRGGVLLLAPTGKATVRLSESLNDEEKSYRTMNIAQLLLKSGRYDKDDKRYTLDGKKIEGIEETVIIDESSMLTTEMMGALLSAIGSAKRIIFVGDPHQLPPIGAGRPFVDLVNILKQKIKPGFPKVCSSYGELTMNRRQKEKGIERLDVKLAELFSGNENIIDEDVISEILKEENSHINIYRWESKEELHNKLLKLTARMLGMKNENDSRGFDIALGANIFNDRPYFNIGCAKKVNEWQILSPVKNQAYGVVNINHLFHEKYRTGFLRMAKTGRLPDKPFGPEQITYGDKVINTANKWKNSFPDNAESANYVANGEIGIVVNGNKISINGLKVEFSSQKGKVYPYTNDDIQIENNAANLELAYALTIHKAQGSQFNKVILVLSEPCPLMSRELLYTALTRQVDEIDVLYNGDPHQLLQFTSDDYSDINRRFTDLFASLEGFDYKPRIRKVNNKFYDDKLIHRTEDNTLVRSKSEVIIANMLYNAKIDYEYERPIYFEDEGVLVHPDFVIFDETAGKEWYWEHCGMLEDEKYRKDWERKKQLYARHGIIEGKNLIVTKDVKGRIDSFEIKNIINKFLL